MAVEKLQVYKCNACGNIVEVLDAGSGALECCDEKMVLLDEQTADSSTEKHVPVVEKTADGLKVTVGSTLHPMKEEHYIEWIQVIVNGKSYRQFLKPGDDPVACFCCPNEGDIIAREYCNVHGLWKS